MGRVVDGEDGARVSVEKLSGRCVYSRGPGCSESIPSNIMRLG
jgi:hypothetical protein